MVIPNYSCHSLEIHNQCRTNQTSPNAGSLAQTLIQTRFPSGALLMDPRVICHNLF